MARVSVKLLPREKAFAQAYVGVAKYSPMRAALYAGYEGSKETLMVVGNQVLKRVRVAAYIDRLIKKQVAGPNRVMKEVSDIATAPWRDFIEVEIEGGVTVSVKLKLAEKLKAAELLMKARGQLSDPATRLMDRLIQREILMLMKAQREGKRKAKKELRLRNRAQRALPAPPPGTPGAAPLDLTPVVVLADPPGPPGGEAGQGTSSKRALRDRNR